MNAKILIGDYGKVFRMSDNGLEIVRNYSVETGMILFKRENERVISRTYGLRKDFILFPSTWTLYKRFVKNHKGEWFYLGGKSDEPCMINVSLVNEFLNKCSAKVSFKNLKDLFNKVGGLL